MIEEIILIVQHFEDSISTFFASATPVKASSTKTACELRIHSERWHRFADIGSVEAFLDELAERAEEKGGPLVLRLPRAPGAREARWVQLVGGPVDVQSYALAGPADAAAPATGLAARVEALEAAVAALQAEWAGLRGG